MKIGNRSHLIRIHVWVCHAFLCFRAGVGWKLDATKVILPKLRARSNAFTGVSPALRSPCGRRKSCTWKARWSGHEGVPFTDFHRRALRRGRTSCTYRYDMLWHMMAPTQCQSLIFWDWQSRDIKGHQGTIWFWFFWMFLLQSGQTCRERWRDRLSQHLNFSMFREPAQLWMPLPFCVNQLSKDQSCATKVECGAWNWGMQVFKIGLCEPLRSVSLPTVEATRREASWSLVKFSMFDSHPKASVALQVGNALCPNIWMVICRTGLHQMVQGNHHGGDSEEDRPSQKVLTCSNQRSVDR